METQSFRLLKLKLISLIILTLPLYSIAAGGFVKNPITPINQKHGYDIKLDEAMRIKDDTGDFFFKYIMAVRVAPDGSIFVKDKRELLKFTQDGKFVTNFYKHGQGPGEALYIDNFIVTEDNLIFHDSRQDKVLIFHHKSLELKNEFRLESQGLYSLVAVEKKKLYFVKSSIPDTNGKAEIIEIEKKIISTSYTGKILENLATFPTKYFVVKTGDKFMSDSRSDFLVCSGGPGLLLVSHTPEYTISLYDFRKNQLVNRFSREYPRIEADGESRQYAPGGNYGKISIDGKRFIDVPVAKYHPDIQQLMPYKDKLLAITSTVITGKNTNGKSKKVLVDVFDRKGAYIDNFFFVLPEGKEIIPWRIHYWIKYIDGDYLFASEQDQDGNRVLKKYRISFPSDKL